MKARAGVVAVVLAAGLGERLGGPKALLRSAPRGEPLVVAQCRDRLENEAFRAVAVVREDVALLVAPLLDAISAELVVSRAPPEDGPAGSIAAAAAHLANASFQAAIVTPVDVRVRPATVRALVEAFHEPLIEAASHAGSALAVVPRFAGRRGHPVVLGADALARYRGGAAPPLRDHLRAMGGRVRTLDVDDPWILEDLDWAHQEATLLRFTGDARASFWG